MTLESWIFPLRFSQRVLDRSSFEGSGGGKKVSRTNREVYREIERRHARSRAPTTLLHFRAARFRRNRVSIDRRVKQTSILPRWYADLLVENRLDRHVLHPANEMPGQPKLKFARREINNESRGALIDDTPNKPFLPGKWSGERKKRKKRKNELQSDRTRYSFSFVINRARRPVQRTLIRSVFFPRRTVDSAACSRCLFPALAKARPMFLQRRRNIGKLVSLVGAQPMTVVISIFAAGRERLGLSVDCPWEMATCLHVSRHGPVQSAKWKVISQGVCVCDLLD